MMSVTSAPANLVQALMGADAATPPEQPGVGAAQFAALIAGLGLSPQPVEADASAPTAEPGSDDPAGGDLPTEDGAAKQDADGETDPLAAALAMLPAAVQQAAMQQATMQQAVVGQPTIARADAAATQPMPTISPAALAKMPPAKAVASGDSGAADAAIPTAPFVPDEIEGRVPAASVGLAAGDAAETGTAAPLDARPATSQGIVPAPPSPRGSVQALPLPQLAQAAKGDSDPADMPPPPARPAKTKAYDAAVTALGGTDTATGAPTAPTTQLAVQATITSPHAGGIHETAAGQTPIAHALAQQHLKISSDGQWLDQLARDIATTADANGKLSFHLNPEHLGSLTVEVTRGAEGASVRLTADTDAARTILIDAQPKLEAEARAQGVKIAETHVDLGGQNAQGQGTQGQGARQQQAQAEPMLRTFRAGDLAAGVTTTTTGSARGAAAELYA